MIYLILVILCFPVSVRAFISPDVVSHSISSSLYSFSLITAYFVSGVVFLLGLLTVFWKKVRKLCVFYIIVLFLFFLSFFSFFYFKYYQPLYIGFNDSLNFNISGVDNSDSLMGDSSNIDLSWEDLISMYLSKNLTTKSLPDIGREFQGRDHTTVIHSVKIVDKLVKNSEETSKEIQKIKNKILYKENNEI